MIMHAMRLIKQSINFLNPGQIPVVALDQPMYAITKKVQWTWPNEIGEDHFVVVLGGLHTEMAFMSMIGDVLEGSGWVDTLIKSGLGSPGVVESFLSSPHVKRTQYADEVANVAKRTFHVLFFVNVEETVEHLLTLSSTGGGGGGALCLVRFFICYC